MVKKLLVLMMAVVVAVAVVGCGTEKVTDKRMTLPISLNDGTIGNKEGIYSGTVNKDGKPDGKGRFDAQNSKGIKWYYDGVFKNGHCDGDGIVEFPSIKQKAVGVFKDFAIKTGKLTRRDGTLQGNFVNDELEGDGEYTTKDLKNGKTVCYKGKFEKSKIVEGTLTLDNKIIHKGYFIDWQPSLKPVDMGESQEFKNWEFKVNYAQNIGNEIQTMFEHAKTSGYFLAVNLDITNKGNQNRQLASNMFLLMDSHGKKYKMNSSASLAQHQKAGSAHWHLDKANPSITLNDVFYVFEVPKDSKDLMLVVNGSLTKTAPVKLTITE